MTASIIALDVGGTSIKSGVVQVGGALPEVVGALGQTPLDNGAPAEAILAVFDGVLRDHLATISEGDLRGVALAIPAPFDYASGISLMQHKFAALYSMDIGAALTAYLPPNTPIAFCNDAAAAVLGEARFGAGRGIRRLIGVTLGTGLGACFVADGVTVRGEPGTTADGELYHVPFRGALADDWFSIRGLRARLDAAGLPSESMREAAALAAAGNTAAQAAFQEFGHDLGVFLEPFVTGFGAEAILVLGGLAGAYDQFAGALSSTLSVPALPGTLGGNAPLIGAAGLFV